MENELMEEMILEEPTEALEEPVEVIEAPIEANEEQDMSNGLDMSFGLGDIAPKGNSDGFDMGMDLGLDF